jgi:catechol 2,3-dioxygenase-like lactoylglutathione lyase family enzyme
VLSSQKIIAFISTTQPEKARHFYGEVLGLTLTSEDPFAIVFDANGTMLRVGKMKEFTPQQFTVLGWETRNIDTTVAELENKGIKFERYSLPGQNERGIWTAPGGSAKVAWFKDPDGNVLSISQHSS